MKQTAVNRWFGDAFSQLAPELRGLHLSDQTLSGEVEIFYPQGLAGSIGRRLGAALGMPKVVGGLVLVFGISSVLATMTMATSTGNTK